MKRFLTFAAAMLVPFFATAQATLPPQSGLPAQVLSGTAAPATAYTCDAAHAITTSSVAEYDQITAAGVVTPYVCVSVAGTPTWAPKADVAGAATTAANTTKAADQAAFTGDVQKAAGSFATTVIAVNGGTLPTSASLVGTNATGQIVTSSLVQPCTPVENVVSASATPAFNGNDCLNTLTLTSTVTGFTIAAPTASTTAARTCLLFVQSSTLAVTTVTAPSNYIGFLAISSLLGKRNMQCATWSPSLALWVAESAGAVGH